MKKEPAIHTFTTLLIFFGSLLLFTVFLDQRDFIGFESRFGLFVQEMLRNGPSFFPTTYQQYYPDYPAAQTFLAYLLSLWHQKATVFNTVLPTACASALALVFIYLIGAIQSKRWGLYGVLFAFLTFNFFAASRTVSLDQFTTAVTAASFYLIYSADHYRRWARLAWLPLVALLGFVFRGPIGFVIPASIVLAYYFLEKNYKTFFITAISAALLFALGFAALIGAAYYEGGKTLVNQILIWEVTQRLATSDAQPFYYYFVNAFASYALSFPIACLVAGTLLPGHIKQPQHAQLALLRHLVVWALIILIGLSIPEAKKVRYLLPITPAIALIAAYGFITTDPHRLLHYLRVGVTGFCRLLPFILGIILLLHHAIPFYSLKSVFTHWLELLAIIQILLIFAIKKIAKTVEQRQLSYLFLGTFTFITLYIGIIEPINVNLNQTQPFVNKTEQLRGSKALVFFQIGPDGEDIKYMVTVDQPLQPRFLQSNAELEAFHTSAVFIAKQNNFAQLPKELQQQFRVLYTGNLGHQKCVVFVRYK